MLHQRGFVTAQKCQKFQQFSAVTNFSVEIFKEQILFSYIPLNVIPAEAGIQSENADLDPRDYPRMTNGGYIYE
jgi:hypothetical protein